MDGVPDLSALLKGQLKLLATKDKAPSSSAGADPASARTSLPTDPEVQERLPEVGASDPGSAAGSAENKRRKKKSGKKRARDESASNETEVAADVVNQHDPDPSEGTAPSESLDKKKRRKKKKDAENSVASRDGIVDPSLGVQSEGILEEPSVLANSPPRDEVLLRKDASDALGQSGGSPKKKKSKDVAGPLSSVQSAPQLGGSAGGNFPVRGLAPDFRDRISFSYDERMPLILNPPRCAELTRQIRGDPVGLPPVEELTFKELYAEAACSSKRNEANMNLLVAAYEGELRRTVVQLAAAEKLARVRQLAIDRVKGELKEAKDKAIEDKEILREQFEKLEGKLKSSQSAKKKLSDENAALNKKIAALEEHNASISAEFVMNSDAVALLQRSEDEQLETELPAKTATPSRVVETESSAKGPPFMISDGSLSEEEGGIGDSPSPLLVNNEVEAGGKTMDAEAAGESGGGAKDAADLAGGEGATDPVGAKDRTDLETHPEGREP
ncbi:Uncharacterized protein Rs2_41107 [Raphanus sativus]|nr:Uncharacterized protein Rs2_41107 [Raphanus sativus]